MHNVVAKLSYFRCPDRCLIVGHTHFLVAESSTQIFHGGNTHIIFSLSPLCPLSFFDKANSLLIDAVHSRLTDDVLRTDAFVNDIPAFLFMFLQSY